MKQTNHPLVVFCFPDSIHNLWNHQMTEHTSSASLRGAVIGWAIMGLFGIPLAVACDLLGGWRWPPYNAVYDQMMVSIYIAVGICSAMAIRNPLKHTSFLWFVAVSSFTHGGVMLYHALSNPQHRGHLIGDVWIVAGGLSLAIPLWRLRKYQD